MPGLEEDQIVELALVMAGRFHRIIKGELYDNGAVPAPHRHRYAWLDSGILLSHLTFALEGKVDAEGLWLQIMTRTLRLVMPDGADRIDNLLMHAKEYRDIWMEHYPNGAPLSVVLEVGINSAYNIDESIEPSTRRQLVIVAFDKCFDAAGGLVTQFYTILRKETQLDDVQTCPTPSPNKKDSNDKNSNDERSDSFYLRYVTFSEVLRGFKWVVAWWLGLSVATPIVGLLFDAAKTVAVDHTFLGAVPTFLGAVPKPFWIWLAIAVCSWVFRGQTITLPKLRFVEWALSCVCFGGMMLANAFLSLWAASPICWGLLLFDFGYYLLIEKGRANYEDTLSRMQKTNGN